MNKNTDFLLTSPPESDTEETLDFQALLSAFLDAKWIIIAATALGLLLASFYAWRLPPVYEAEALLQVEQGQSSLATPFAGGQMAESNMALRTELQILRSRRVVGNAVDSLGYQISVSPNFFPVIGRAYARSATPGTPREAPLGFDSYAWGGEVLEIPRFDIPAQLEGRRFMLTAIGPAEADSSHFEFNLRLAGEESVILRGTVGEPASANIDGALLEIFVRELIANPGTEFYVTRRTRESAAIDLRNRMNTSEAGQGTGVVRLSVTHPEQTRVAAMANALARTFQQHNLQRRSAQAEQTIEFIKRELSRLEAELSQVETRLNDFRLNEGAIDLSRETQLLLERGTNIDKSIETLKQQREELLQRYLPDHPSIEAISHRIERLKQSEAELDQQIRQLPERQQQMLRLQRDVTVTTTLYSAMQNRIQEYELVRAGLIGNIHIIDEALTPRGPTGPNRSAFSLLGAILGLALASLFVFTRFMMRTGVDDPDAVENRLGLPSYAVIPFSPNQGSFEKKRNGHGKHQILAVTDPRDVTIEAVRSLRTALQFALMGSDNKTVMITGPMPGIGKTFITLNLGAVLAMSGKKVLLIDGDLRKGHLHLQSGLAKNPGVPDYIASHASLGDVIQASAVEGLDIIARGDSPPNPSELLMHPRFNALLDEAKQEYDHIIIDTPPVLLVTDAAIVGSFCGASLMVLKAGSHPMRAIEEATKRLRHADVPLKGVIFNQVGRKGASYYSSYGYGYGGYYEYEKHA